jgi:hypothetical protein
MNVASQIVPPSREVRKRLHQKDREEFEASVKSLTVFGRMKARFRFWMWGAPNHRLWFADKQK